MLHHYLNLLPFKLHHIQLAIYDKKFLEAYTSILSVAASYIRSIEANVCSQLDNEFVAISLIGMFSVANTDCGSILW